MTFGAYRAFQAWARSTRAVRNHFFLLMTILRLLRKQHGSALLNVGAYHTNLLSRRLRLGDRLLFQLRHSGYQQKNRDGGIVGLLTFTLQLCDR
jgi:hypothetical protein